MCRSRKGFSPPPQSVIVLYVSIPKKNSLSPYFFLVLWKTRGIKEEAKITSGSLIFGEAVVVFFKTQ